jgi:KaiC/GvpD/RAD55 family RecA-like ATPase
MLLNSNNNGAFSATSVNVDETIIEAADAIIGGLLLDKAAITWMYDILDLQYFPLRRHKLIIQVIKDLHQRSLVIDLMTVTMELDRRGQLEQAGGKVYLAAVLEKTISAVNIDQYFFLLVNAIDNYSPDGTIRPAVALELVKEYWISDRSEEELVLDLEELRERVGMKAYRWDKFIAATVRKCRKVRYKLELKRLLAIGDELERSVEIDEVCEIYRKGRRTVERDLTRMEAKTQEKAHPLDNGDLGDFLAMETQAVDWIYPGIVPAGELVMISAAPKCGKTLWATDLMYAVVSGEPLHGHDIPQGRVLYYWGDEPSPRSVQRRLRNRGFDLVSDFTRMRPRSSLDLGNLEKLETELETFRPTLVVIDSLTAVSKSINISENDAAFARYIYQLGELLGKYNAAGILIHHDNKNHEQKGIEKVAGSARLVAAVWGIAQMKASDPDNPKCTERWLSVTPREGSPETYLFDLNPKEIWSDQGIFSFTGELGDETGQKRTQGDRVLALLKKYPGKGLEYLEIDSYLNIGRSLYTVLDRLEDRKLITRRRSTINPRRWVYLVENETTNCKENVTQNFSLPDPSFSQQVVESNSESVDIQKLEVSQQLVNNSVNTVNNLVNTDPVEIPPVELDNPETEEDVDVRQQNPTLNSSQKKNVVQDEGKQVNATSLDDSVLEVEVVDESVESVVTPSGSDEGSLSSSEDVKPMADSDYLNLDEVNVGDRVKVLAGSAGDRQGTVEAIDPLRVLEPYCIRLDNGCVTDEPLFNLKRI